MGFWEIFCLIGFVLSGFNRGWVWVWLGGYAIAAIIAIAFLLIVIL